MASRAETVSHTEVLERWRHMAAAFNRAGIPCDMLSYLAIVEGLSLMAQAPDGGFALPDTARPARDGGLMYWAN
ncbi:MAG TPA: hypothetical protein VK886_21725 [Vicinamibacterales bacterium]|nr:hypothetical protein [Vicinamibacterales bacterium]